MQQSKQKIQVAIELIEFNFPYQKSINIPMKLASPFLQYIPDCKKKMRRLRKKIYKYLTSKNHTKFARKPKQQTHVVFKEANLPHFVQELLYKKKRVDLTTIKNISVGFRIPVTEMAALVSKQEAHIKGQHMKWQLEQQEKQRRKQQIQLHNTFLKEMLSRNTISSTESFEFNELQSKNQSQARNICDSFCNELNVGSHPGGQFSLFRTENGFLQIESSIISYENLFK